LPVADEAAIFSPSSSGSSGGEGWREEAFSCKLDPVPVSSRPKRGKSFCETLPVFDAFGSHRRTTIGERRIQLSNWAKLLEYGCPFWRFSRNPRSDTSTLPPGSGIGKVQGAVFGFQQCL